MKRYWLIVLGLVMAAGCASNTRNGQAPLASLPADEEAFVDDAFFDEFEEQYAQAQVAVADPLESLNRAMFGLNDALYFGVAKPVIETYEKAVPRPARVGIRNFFNNIRTPIRVVNCLLQGKPEQAGGEIDRFFVNTTMGVLGFGDPATDRYKMASANEDLGQTLAVYGLDDGFYVVWPLLGPSTLRDSAGMVGDAFLNPVRYVKPVGASIGISATRMVNNGSFHTGEYEAFKAAAVDPYIAMRTAYVQYRKQLIHDAAIDSQE